MTTTPLAERVHITLFGLRNAGKSSLMNAVAGRSLSIVSPEPGTTTDPVTKSMELGGLGPVAITDTAGLDDEGELGRLRVEKSLERLSWTDVAILATPLDRAPEAVEAVALRRLAAAGRAVVVVGTFADRAPHPAKEAWLASLAGGGSGGDATESRIAPPRLVLRASGATGAGVPELRGALAALEVPGGAPLGERSPLDGLAGSGDLLLLVTPIDSAAPKGRLILPQAEVLRDALDRGCAAMVCRETELPAAYAALSRRPRLVVTDSQAFAQVAAAIPADQPLTSFSILFARKKGELSRFTPGLRRLEELAGAAKKPDPAPLRLLAVEACTHNRTHEDIATVKIPKLLAARTGRLVELTVVRELSDAPSEGRFDLAAVCGGCMATRSRMLAQLDALETGGTPAVNFGLFLAWAHGAFPRAVEPFAGAGEDRA